MNSFVNASLSFKALGTNHPALYTDMVMTSKPHWIADIPEELQKEEILHCQFTFQHTNDLIDCEVIDCRKGLIVRLKEEIRALTEGQYAVFYKEDECLGSAQICNVGPSKYFMQWMNKSVSGVSEKFDQLEEIRKNLL